MDYDGLNLCFHFGRSWGLYAWFLGQNSALFFFNVVSVVLRYGGLYIIY